MGLATQTFDILTRLAIGNGALVYRAVDKRTLRQVALKLLTQDDEVDHHVNVEGLLADAPRLRAIYGAHVCQLLDAFQDDDGPVLVYEYVNGLSGADFPQQRKLDATQALDVAAQLISALRSGERQRMPHGDLKPSNLIFVDQPEGRPFTFVLDWGLAAHRQTLPDDTLFYLAPERLNGAPASHTADLFSAGALLFYLYTGKVLVAGGTKEQVAGFWRNARPAVLAELRPDLPAKLVQWVCSLLEFDPAKRPASAVDAGSTLAALNPPPPMAPPENIRPRPVSGLAQQPARPATPASGIAAPPAPRSGIRPPPASASNPAAGTPRPQPVPVAPMTQAVPVPAGVRAIPSSMPKTKNPLPAILLGALTAILLAGGLWYLVRQKHAEKEEGYSEAERIAESTPERTSTKASNSGSGSKKTNSKSDKKNPVQTVSLATDAGGKPSSASSGPPKDFLTRESFAYSDGTSLAGATGGKGWAEPWQGPAVPVSGPSLAYPDHPAAGSGLLLKENDQEAIWSRSAGAFTRLLPDPQKGGSWYFGLLLEHHNQGVNTTDGDVQFNPFNTREIAKIMRIVVADTGSVTKFTISGGKSIEVPDNGKPRYILVRFEARPLQPDGKCDLNVRFWVNPDLSAPQAPKPQLEMELKDQQLPPDFGVMIRKKSGPTVTRVDEIRYGLRWSDMVFKTSVLGKD